MSTSELKGEIAAVLALLKCAEEVNGSQAAGLVAKLLLYAMEMKRNPATVAVVAASLDAIEEMMKREGLI